MEDADTQITINTLLASASDFPPTTSQGMQSAFSLLSTSKQVRDEAIPYVHPVLHFEPIDTAMLPLDFSPEETYSELLPPSLRNSIQTLRYDGRAGSWTLPCDGLGAFPHLQKIVIEMGPLCLPSGVMAEHAEQHHVKPDADNILGGLFDAYILERAFDAAGEQDYRSVLPGLRDFAVHISTEIVAGFQCSDKGSSNGSIEIRKDLIFDLETKEVVEQSPWRETLVAAVDRSYIDAGW